MVQKICPECNAGNAVESDYCGRCGALLSTPMVVPRRSAEITLGSGSLLPAKSWQQVGRAVAVSLGAIAAEAAISWLRRRLADAPTPAGSGKSMPIVPAPRPRQPVVRGFSRRVVRIWRGGKLTDELVEQSEWQLFDE